MTVKAECWLELDMDCQTGDSFDSRGSHRPQHHRVKRENCDSNNILDIVEYLNISSDLELGFLSVRFKLCGVEAATR